MATKHGVLATVAVILLLVAPHTSAQDGQIAEFSYHDGIPSYQISNGGGGDSVIGVFYHPTDFMRPFLLSRIRFYHGGNYGDSGEPPRFRIAVVHRANVGTEYEHWNFIGIWPQEGYAPIETTCNYCWEDVYIPYNGLPIHLIENTSDYGYGAFIYREELRPKGRGIPPYPWLDAVTEHPLTTAAPAFVPGTWTIYDCPYSEIGDMLMDIEITYIDEIATEELSFSVIKSRY